MQVGDISQYHYSVRHYQAPFPLAHRNARAFAAPATSQGPWGTGNTSPRTDVLDHVERQRNKMNFSIAHDYGETRSSRVPQPSPGRQIRVGRGEYSMVGTEIPGWGTHMLNIRSAATSGCSGGDEDDEYVEQRRVFRAPVAHLLKPNNHTGPYGKFSPTVMGMKLAASDPQYVPTKCTQYNPTRDAQDETLRKVYGDRVASSAGRDRQLPQRLPPTPLISEVDERLRLQGYGSLLDVRFATDEAISDLLRSIGFGATDRMTILWELRRRHPQA
jgi:hypothetical protein